MTIFYGMAGIIGVHPTAEASTDCCDDTERVSFLLSYKTIRRGCVLLGVYTRYQPALENLLFYSEFYHQVIFHVFYNCADV